MAVLHLTAFETLALGTVLLLIGYALQQRFTLLRRHYLPAPALGGLLGAVLLLLLRQLNIVDVQLNINLQPLFFAGFFASIGFRVTVKMLKNNTARVLWLLLITVGIAFLQKAMGILLGPLFGIGRVTGLTAAAAHMDGGMMSGTLIPVLAQHSTNPAPVFSGVVVLSVTLSCFLGGPLFRYLQQKYSLGRGGKPSPEPLLPLQLVKHIAVYAVTLTAATLLAQTLDTALLPAHALALLIAALWRNFDLSLKEQRLSLHYLNVLGSASLSLCLVLVFMNVDLAAVAQLPAGVIVLVLIQIALVLGAALLTFRLLGRDLLAALVAAGLPGFALGLPPDTMSALQCIQENNGPVPAATFVVPVVGAWFILFINPWIISIVVAWL